MTVRSKYGVAIGGVHRLRRRRGGVRPAGGMRSRPRVPPDPGRFLDAGLRARKPVHAGGPAVESGGSHGAGRAAIRSRASLPRASLGGWRVYALGPAAPLVTKFESAGARSVRADHGDDPRDVDNPQTAGLYRGDDDLTADKRAEPADTGPVTRAGVSASCDFRIPGPSGRWRAFAGRRWARVHRTRCRR